MQAAFPKLLYQGAGSHAVDGLARIVFPDVHGRGLAGGIEVLISGRDSHGIHFFHIVGDGSGGVVGDENIASSFFSDVLQKIKGSFKNLIFIVNRAVHVKKPQLFGFQGIGGFSGEIGDHVCFLSTFLVAMTGTPHPAAFSRMTSPI